MANTYTDGLKLRQPAIGDTNWGDEMNDNAAITEAAVRQILRGNFVEDGLTPTDGGGLVVNYAAGNVTIDGTSFAITASNKTCTASAVNWLFVDSLGVVQIDVLEPLGQYAMIALIDASAADIDRIADLRNFAAAGAPEIVYTPINYTPDTGETEVLDQHIAGIDNRFGLISGFKNKLINGDFTIWQRGINFTTAGFTADRWIMNVTGTTHVTSRQAFTTGQADVPNYPKYYSRFVITSVAGAGNRAAISQPIENVPALANRTLTLSFYAKADAAKNIAFEIGQYFGTGGAPSATITGAAIKTFNLTTAWQKFTFTFTLPSLAGKTLGTDANHYHFCQFWLDAGSDWDARTNTLGQQSGTFDFSQIQLEAGADPTPFDERPITVELALCQRYFQSTYPPGMAPGATSAYGGAIVGRQITTGWAIWHGHHFPQPMRATPTVIWYSVTSGTANMIFFSSTGDVAATATYNIGSSGIAGSTSLGASVPAGDTYYLHYTADAEL